MLNAQLWSWLLFDYIPDEAEKEESAVPSAGSMGRLLRMNGVSTLICGVTVSQHLIVKSIGSTRSS